MTTAVRTSGQTDRTSTFMEVKTMEEIRAELNKAIWYVIISEGKPKKEMKNEVALIKKAGYQINKCDRNQWEVYNSTTQRRVSAKIRWREITVDNSYRSTYRINTEGLSSYTSIYNDAYNRRPIDFVGILNKPINEEWRRLCWHRAYAGSRHDTIYSTQFKYQQLKDAKWSIKYDKDRIARDKKRIEDAQKDLANDIEAKVKSEQRLKELRKKLGLKERR